MSYDDLASAVMVHDLEAHLRGGPPPETKEWVDRAFYVMYNREDPHGIKHASKRVLDAWLKAMYLVTDGLIAEYGGSEQHWTQRKDLTTVFPD